MKYVLRQFFRKKVINWKLLVLCEISTHLLYMNEGFVSFRHRLYRLDTFVGSIF
jgi:hypothetical protein